MRKTSKMRGSGIAGTSYPLAVSMSVMNQLRFAPGGRIGRLPGKLASQALVPRVPLDTIAGL